MVFSGTPWWWPSQPQSARRRPRTPQLRPQPDQDLPSFDPLPPPETPLPRERILIHPLPRGPISQPQRPKNIVEPALAPPPSPSPRPPAHALTWFDWSGSTGERLPSIRDALANPSILRGASATAAAPVEAMRHPLPRSRAEGMARRAGRPDVMSIRYVISEDREPESAPAPPPAATTSMGTTAPLAATALPSQSPPAASTPSPLSPTPAPAAPVDAVAPPSVAEPSTRAGCHKKTANAKIKAAALDGEAGEPNPNGPCQRCLSSRSPGRRNNCRTPKETVKGKKCNYCTKDKVRCEQPQPVQGQEPEREEDDAMDVDPPAPPSQQQGYDPDETEEEEEEEAMDVEDSEAHPSQQQDYDPDETEEEDP
ncbi:hypothetical protein PG993_008731 [Apiospora rasikravindrae]|uniref:Zn(2)-C6 fungal-type domain-containing protein n=1 Tax=Apiospora rasikravindrae TaxID=990691 RepID=A0ABR1SPA1_9PEZI